MNSVFTLRPWLAFMAAFIAVYASPRLVAQGGEPLDFAIRGATVVPVAGPRIENATIIVEHGVITGISKNPTIPERASIIDGNGLVVYPGLFDAFTDVGLNPASRTPVGERECGPQPQLSGGPEDRPGSPWRDAADEVSLADKHIETWRSAGFTTVFSGSRDGIFPGRGAVLDLAGEYNGDLVVKARVAIPISLRPSGNSSNFPDSLMGVVGYVSQVWLDTEWSIKARATYEKNPRGLPRPRYDRTDIILADAVENRTLVLIPANNAVQIHRALGLANRWHISAGIYGGQMAYEVAEDLAASRVPVLVDLKWPERNKDDDPDILPSLRELRFRDRAPSSPAVLAKAGVKFAFYSGQIVAPKDILKAVKKSIDSGLAPDAAIRALTLTPAEIFGVADRVGSIETGKIANLVVADGDLFDERTKIKYVFVDGHQFTIREPEKPRKDSSLDTGDEQHATTVRNIP